jgi:hypothetical protein
MYDMAMDNFWHDGNWKSWAADGAPQGSVGADAATVAETQDQMSDSGKYKIYLRTHNGKSYTESDEALTGAEEAAPTPE